MAILKSVVTLFALTAVTAGTTTKASPPANGIGAAQGVDGITAGSTVGMRIKNGATGPGAAGAMTLQQSPNGGTSWFDVHTMGGTTTANDDLTMTVSVPRGVKSLRVLCYGHTTNDVSYEAILTAVTE
jgi:hypothetical protein